MDFKKEYLNAGIKMNYETAVMALKRRLVYDPSFYGQYYFVYSTDDIDESWFFESADDVERFITQTFWDTEQYEYMQNEDYMEDWRVWKFTSEERVKRLPYLCKDAKPTRFKDNQGNTIYRIPVTIWAEQTINVGLREY